MTIETLYRQLLPCRQEISAALTDQRFVLSRSRLFVLSALFVHEGGANDEIRTAVTELPADIANPELARLRHKNRIGEVTRDLRRYGLVTHTAHGPRRRYRYQLAPHARDHLRTCLASAAA